MDERRSPEDVLYCGLGTKVCRSERAAITPRLSDGFKVLGSSAQSRELGTMTSPNLSVGNPQQPCEAQALGTTLTFTFKRGSAVTEAGYNVNTEP